MSGTEVERIATFGVSSTEGFVVGRVSSVESHPDADRLAVCTVDTGATTRTIVCGAPNVAPGQSVAVALPGATLADGTTLGQAKLRGVVSDGMILSEVELEIGDDADGIMVLAGPAGSAGADASNASSPVRSPEPQPGAALSDVLGISDSVLELEITPNRPDCLGVFGVARELHAVTGSELSAEPWGLDGEAAGDDLVSDYASVAVDIPELCPRFTARVFTDVHVGPSPIWLRARLAAAGQRSINNVVDVTNYVMLLTAQPLHAFDLDQVPDGALTVRAARDGEKLTTLDGEQRKLDSESVLVCDANGASAIAGIMGGQSSQISSSTTRLLLEVANWDGVNVLRTSNRIGLRSEASARFEKQLHPALTMRAQRIAARLLMDVCGARLVPGTIDVEAEPPAARQVQLTGRRVERLLGMPIDAADSAAYLGRLGFEVERSGADLEVEVPPDRYSDVSREADLIEEVVRIHGLDQLPSTLPQGGNRSGRLARADGVRRRAEDELRDRGFNEIVSWSFTGRGLPARLRIPGDLADGQAIAVSNPLSEGGTLMRTTLLGGLLDAAQHNFARGAGRTLLFESGRVYLRETPPQVGGPLAGVFPGLREAPAHEPHRIGALAVGPIRPPSWQDSAAASPADSAASGAGFFELKGVLEDACRTFGIEPRLAPGRRSFLHPGRAASVELNGAEAGWIGELHPLVVRDWDLPGGLAFELDLGILTEAGAMAERFEDVATFPAVYQDIAVVVGEETSAQEVTEAVVGGGGELLRSATVFDLYAGDQIGAGKKSLALKLEFRAVDRTLTDPEVAERREAIRGAVDAIGGALRE